MRGQRPLRAFDVVARSLTSFAHDPVLAFGHPAYLRLAHAASPTAVPHRCRGDGRQHLPEKHVQR